MQFLLIIIFTLGMAVSPSSAGDGGEYRYLWGGFSTSIVDRSPQQLQNAVCASRQIHGTLIPPGGVFSFNELVGGRDRQKGYIPAPAIDQSGYLNQVPGGGICQLATTIYNAGLYAGLEVVERHPHSRSVSYVPPGRDATIATWRKDLKLRNPHGVPLVLKVHLRDRKMTAGFWSVSPKEFQVEINSDISSLEPETATSGAAGSGCRGGQKGRKGFSVVTSRVISQGGLPKEETVSSDFYPPPSHILKESTR